MALKGIWGISCQFSLATFDIITIIKIIVCSFLLENLLQTSKASKKSFEILHRWRKTLQSSTNGSLSVVYQDVQPSSKQKSVAFMVYDLAI